MEGRSLFSVVNVSSRSFQFFYDLSVLCAVKGGEPAVCLSILSQSNRLAIQHNRIISPPTTQHSYVMMNYIRDSQSSLRESYDNTPRIIGSDASSPSFSIPITHHRITCSQESLRSHSTSQEELVSVDGGRAHARFQEFVARTRHMELLDMLHEMRSKINNLEEKIAFLSNSRADQNTEMMTLTMQKLDDLLQQSLSDQDFHIKVESAMDLIGNEVRKGAEMITSLTTQVQRIDIPLKVKTMEASTITSPTAYPKENMCCVESSLGECEMPTQEMDIFMDDDSEPGGISLSQYLDQRRAAVQVSIYFLV